SGYSVLYF
nr:neuropeptide [Holothuria glaberrima]